VSIAKLTSATAALLAAAVLAAAVFAGSAAAAEPAYAPLNEPGPPLSVPNAALASSLYCPSAPRRGELVVLLVAGTGATPAEQYSWNYEPALTAQGIAWCAVTLPEHELANDEDAGEYMVYAIRTLHAATHRRIDIIGHSQGGMVFRWALRFWPDTRAMVDDLISLAGDNHGTAVMNELDICASTCVAAAWQQRPQANFIAALNSDAETFAGISYTNVYTDTDELSTPAGPNGTTPLHTGQGEITNLAIQAICPADLDEHVALGSIDPVGFALALDAIRHPGPADLARIPKSVCGEGVLPGADLTSPFEPGILEAVLYLSSAATPVNFVGAAKLSAEPPLACYVFATCGGADAPTLVINVRRLARSRIRVLVRTKEGGVLVPVPGVTVRIRGRRVLTGAGGTVNLRMRLRRSRHYRLTVSRSGCNSATVGVG
jgi:pimeloyl-ACP methyl ester carboxylesterase